MHNNKTRLSLLAGLLAAILWSAADMLLVGFVSRPEASPLFSQELAGQLNSALAILMLEGSPRRLYWGIYLASFSVVLYVLAVHGVYQLLPRGNTARLAALALLIGYALSPIGHAGFGYLGLQAQSMQNSTPETLAAQITAFNQFEHLLNVHWLASVSASALGWLLVLWLVLRGQSHLPRLAVLLNPILIAILVGVGCAQFPGSLAAVLLGCASLNIAQFIFFASALALTQKHTSNPKPSFHVTHV